MRINSKVPKTFSIFARKGKKEGYIRFIAQEKNSEVTYSPKFVDDISDASKFVNFDNAKDRASAYVERFRLDEAKVVDDKLMKAYNVKKEKVQK
jgi:hypothetical protein